MQQSISTERFKIMYCELKASRKIENKSDLAEALDLYPAAITLIEQGKRKITADELILLNRLFKVNPNYICGLETKMFI